ncbi:MAG: alpha/beta hydrolase-fold protein [Cyclobacteriaceae bacterium]
MRKITLVVWTIISLHTVFAQGNRVEDLLNFELAHTQVIPIKDNQADRQYELYVKLPEGYSENDTIEYPVIYYTDAVWHIEILSAATEFLIEDVILVGISWQKDNNEELVNEIGEHVSRYRDYSIQKSSNPEHQAKFQRGQASKHLTFIRTDVITYVENNYRTDPNNRSYFGYSMGGKFGAYILLSQPETFKNYILGSPGLNIPAFADLNAKATNDLNANVFISYGDLEKELGQHAEAFITMLKNRKDESLLLEHVVIKGSHQTAFPMTGVRSVTWLSNLTKD